MHCADPIILGYLSKTVLPKRPKKILHEKVLDLLAEPNPSEFLPETYAIECNCEYECEKQNECDNHQIEKEYEKQNECDNHQIESENECEMEWENDFGSEFFECECGCDCICYSNCDCDCD